MEMTLSLPQNYVEIEQEEMMYLDGGWSKRVLGKNLLGIYNWASNRMGRGVGLALRQVGFYNVAYSCAYYASPATTGAIVAAIGKGAATLLKYGPWVAAGALAALAAGAVYLGTYRVFY